MFRAKASMLFSTNSATAFNGFCCERAIIVIAFQSSPIRNRPEFFMMNGILLVPALDALVSLWNNCREQTLCSGCGAAHCNSIKI
jgi:hypothetical protein